jgi:hypothetical protein
VGTLSVPFVCYYGKYWLLVLFLDIVEYYFSHGYFCTIVLVVTVVTVGVVVTVLSLLVTVVAGLLSINDYCVVAI